MLGRTDSWNVERLEARTLLTTIYDFDAISASDAGFANSWYDYGRSIAVEQYGGVVVSSSSLGGGSTLKRSDGTAWVDLGESINPGGEFIESGESFVGLGSLKADGFDPNDEPPPLGVVSLLRSGTVRQLWVGDASAPDMRLIAWGSQWDGSFRIVVEFEDSFRLDDSNLSGLKPELRSPSDALIKLDSRKIDSDSSDWSIMTVARYAFDFDAPGGSWDSSDNGTYTFTIDAGAFKDSVGNEDENGLTFAFGISCPSSGLDSTGQSWKPGEIADLDPIERLPISNWRTKYEGFRGQGWLGIHVAAGSSTGATVLSRTADGDAYQVVELSAYSDPVYHPVALDAQIVSAWGTSVGSFVAWTSSSAASFTPSRLVHIDDSGVITTIVDQSDFVSWNTTPSMSSSESVPSVSHTGSVVAWYGTPSAKGASRASTHAASGFFAAVRSGVSWSLIRVAGEGGNGYIEAGETFADYNRNQRFDEGVKVPTQYGSAFEDFGTIGIGYRIHVSDTQSGGGFQVLLSQRAAPELWVVNVAPDSASPGGFSVSSPDLVLQPAWDAGDDDDWTVGTSFWWWDEPIKEIWVSDRAINSREEMVFFAITDSGENLIVRAKPAGLRPVLYVPGIMGSFPKTQHTVEWLLQRGAPPEWLEIDPLANGYADILKTLDNAGYEPGVNLLSAVYDWRMAPGPAPIREGGAGAIDGFIDGISAASITDGVFEYGVDYLGYWLKQAAALWASSHPNVPLDSVDIIAHSTGGLVTRTYIQSAAYFNAELPGLPRVNEFVMIGVPNRGASKAWNVGHDNWIADPAYMAVFSTIMEVAREKMLAIGQIFGPSGTSITPAMVASHARRLDPVNPNEYEAFIDLYCPTIRSLAATYPMLDIDKDGVPELAVGRAGGAHALDVPNPLLERNEWVLDLNNGLDLNYTSWSFTDLFTDPMRDPNRFGGHRAGGHTGVTVIYGESTATLSFASARQGPADEASIAQVFRMTDEVPHPAGPSERWYRDRSHDVGDLTVPRQSSRDQFLGDLRFRVRGFSSDPASTSGPGVTTGTSGKTDHVGLNSNPDVQRLVLSTFGMAPITWQISTTLAAVDAWAAGGAVAGLLIISLVADPVQTYIVDGLGRRFGWTEATGPLTEIPGSIYRGGADGFGFLAGEIVQPVSFVTIGLGGEHFSKVKMTRGDQSVGAESRGLLAAGQQRVQSLAPPSPVNTHEADRVLRALVDAVPSVSVGPDGAIAIGMVNTYGQTTLFKRNAADAGWNAREPDPFGAAGSPSSDAATWRDPKDGKFYAAVPTDQGLLLFQESAAGEWTVRNLSTEINGAGVITSKITQWKTNPTRNNVFRVVGTLANGDVVQYEQTVSTTANGYRWNFKNLSDDLRAIGQVTPEFDGRLVAYSTAWDAWHIAGLDAEGQIQTIWRGPKMSQWVLSNLSAVTGAPSLSGGLSVYLTPWQGINLAGVDQNGQLQITWWIPRFVGTWVVSNLTASIAAPPIDGDSIVSFNTPAGGLNMAARTANDELVVFWWVPGAPGNKWRVQQVSQAVPSSTTVIVPEGELSAVSDGNGATSIVGRGPDGDVVRFHGSVIDHAWNMELLTDVAQLR